MRRRMSLVSIVITLALALSGVNGLAEMNADELAAASEAKAVATEKDPLTMDLIMKKVVDACALLEKKGEAAFPAFQGKDSDFIFAGTYIWIHDQKGVMRMHPIKYKLNGKNIINLTDSNGKLFFAVMNEVCEKKGDGWVDYMWPKPGEKQPSAKTSYVKQVKFGNDTFVVGCGTYDEKIIASANGQ